VPLHRDRGQLARRSDRGHATGSGVVMVPVYSLTDTLGSASDYGRRIGSDGIRLLTTAMLWRAQTFRHVMHFAAGAEHSRNSAAATGLPPDSWAK